MMSPVMGQDQKEVVKLSIKGNSSRLCDTEKINEKNMDMIS